MAENTATGATVATPEAAASEKTSPATPPEKEAGTPSPGGDKVVSIEQAQQRQNGRKAPDAPEQAPKADKTATDRAAAEVKQGKTAPKKPPAQRKPPEKKATPPKKAAPTKGKVATGKGKSAPAKAEAPVPEPPPEPRAAPRSGEAEKVDHIKLEELHAFKNHPFSVRDDAEMRAMVESVKDKGVTQPIVVRPREGGGYEIVSGHRRHMASQMAGYTDIPCVVRDLTDEQAITQMVEDNTTQRETILPSERAKALKMQLDAIKRQGARTSGQIGPKSNGKENGQRSNQIVAERNGMPVKQVQRYIRLNNLVPDLKKMVDEKKIGFISAVELSYVKPPNQRYIAVAIEGQQSSPSQAQAKRMRELDEKGLLNSDVIDGIMLEEKKEVDKVILSAQELSQYFGKDKTPREMKDTIMSLLEQYKAQQKDLPAQEKKPER